MRRFCLSNQALHHQLKFTKKLFLAIQLFHCTFSIYHFTLKLSTLQIHEILSTPNSVLSAQVAQKALCMYHIYVVYSIAFEKHRIDISEHKNSFSKCQRASKILIYFVQFLSRQKLNNIFYPSTIHIFSLSWRQWRNIFRDIMLECCNFVVVLFIVVQRDFFNALLAFEIPIFFCFRFFFRVIKIDWLSFGEI